MSVFRIDDVMVCALSGWWCALSQAWREVQRRSVDALNVWRGVCLDDLPALTSDLVGLELGLQSRRGGGGVTVSGLSRCRRGFRPQVSLGLGR